MQDGRLTIEHPVVVVGQGPWARAIHTAVRLLFAVGEPGSNRYGISHLLVAAAAVLDGGLKLPPRRTVVIPVSDQLGLRDVIHLIRRIHAVPFAEARIALVAASRSIASRLEGAWLTGGRGEQPVGETVGHRIFSEPVTMAEVFGTLRDMVPVSFELWNGYLERSQAVRLVRQVVKEMHLASPRSLSAAQGPGRVLVESTVDWRSAVSNHALQKRIELLLGDLRTSGMLPVGRASELADALGRFIGELGLAP